MEEQRSKQWVSCIRHDPIYHQGEGSVVRALSEVRQRFPETTITDPIRKRQLLLEIKDVYKRAPFDNLNMWPVARDWLRKHMPHDLVPD